MREGGERGRDRQGPLRSDAAPRPAHEPHLFLPSLPPPPKSPAARDTSRRLRASRAAARLPRFTSDASAAAFAADALGALPSEDGGASTSGSFAVAAAPAAAAPSGPKDSFKDPAVAGVFAMLASRRGGKVSDAGVAARAPAVAAVAAHHSPPAMADGLAVDEDGAEEELLQFKETPSEVGAGGRRSRGPRPGRGRGHARAVVPPAAPQPFPVRL
jgi:hypothetical protein